MAFVFLNTARRLQYRFALSCKQRNCVILNKYLHKTILNV